MSEGFDLSCYKSSSAKKKKTMPKKNILSVAPNFLKSSCKSKINRKSIDWGNFMLDKFWYFHFPIFCWIKIDMFVSEMGEVKIINIIGNIEN